MDRKQHGKIYGNQDFGTFHLFDSLVRGDQVCMCIVQPAFFIFLQGVLRTVARCSKAGISDVGIFDFREIQWIYNDLYIQVL